MWGHSGPPTRETPVDDAKTTRSPDASAASRASPHPATPSLDELDRSDGLRRLQAGLDEFCRTHLEAVQSSERVISPLLDLWSLAIAVDHATAAPIEALLTGLVVRTTTTSTELLACIHDVEAILNRFSSN